jgi:hypothetical protein
MKNCSNRLTLYNPSRSHLRVVRGRNLAPVTPIPLGFARHIGAMSSVAKQPPTQSHILALLDLFDWTGHVELGSNDKFWLAGELASSLSGGETSTCDVCDCTKLIVITTSLGRICEDCLETFSDEAEATREALGEGDDDTDDNS